VTASENLKPSSSSNTSSNTFASVPIKGGFGTKIDTLVKYLLFLQKKSSSEKSLVFRYVSHCCLSSIVNHFVHSQWKDGLGVIAQALTVNNIRFVQFSGTITKSMKKRDIVTAFQEQDEVKVILLHAKTQSAGLTLVSATHVFIMEPLLNPSMEQQAIARVHRMGQTKVTRVHKVCSLPSSSPRV
jgi:E3 ubiquitin-protein ligase SHPRH